MIHVVGGVYEERCVQPEWSHVYGSGGRAATALASQIPDKVHLATYMDDIWRRNFEARAAQSHFALDLELIPKTVIFSYVHPLSVPIIEPVPQTIAPGPCLKVEGDVVLWFGMMEGEARVEGRRVVYDPQSATQPHLFRANGSTAESLVVVANAHEIRLLSGMGDAEAGARHVLRAERAEAVIVKRGSRGALLVTDRTTEDVPCFKTEFVFSLGSGDIFAAAVALFWGLEGRPLEEAVNLASMATARYCSTQVAELLAAEELVSLGLEPVMARGGRAYLAGPFFNLPQRWMVEEARMHLRGMNLEVFSPLHDVGRGPAEHVAAADLAGLAKCDRMLALVDGADTGTLFEVGYACARNLPVVALAESLTAEDQKMLVGTGCIVTTDFVTAVYKTAWL